MSPTILTVVTEYEMSHGILKTHLPALLHRSYVLYVVMSALYIFLKYLFMYLAAAVFLAAQGSSRHGVGPFVVDSLVVLGSVVAAQA